MEVHFSAHFAGGLMVDMAGGLSAKMEPTETKMAGGGEKVRTTWIYKNWCIKLL